MAETASFSLCTHYGLSPRAGRLNSTLECRIEADLGDGVVPVSPGSAAFPARSQSTRGLSK
ncbi:hypothetical protein AGR4B_pAt20164 [Agrobacterium tumefaciens str. CFBP 5621]|nr:hypothetical protein AGR4B_pAt20164 [Agrobacterium tumefaciens str. CFBP 5621]